MRRISSFLNQKKRAVPKSFALFFLMPCSLVILYILILIYFAQSYFTFPDCLVKRLTGIPCPSCGSTRAVMSLMRFHFLESILFNPLPVLLLSFMFVLWLNAAINIFIRNIDKKLPNIFFWYYFILIIVILFWILRSFFFKNSFFPI